MRETVSACLIVLNEEERLPDALASVEFCDEIIVIDACSTDETVAIAERAGARVTVNPWTGYGAQRNKALDVAIGDWILEIDADERVTPELQRSIERFLEGPPAGIDAAVLPLRHRFLGRNLGASAKYPGYRLRLFRRGCYRHDESRTVHEGLWLNGPASPLEGDIAHILADSWREAVSDTIRYAHLEAQQVATPRRVRSAVTALFVRPTLKFWFRITIMGGWRDSWQGVAKIALDTTNDVIVAWTSLSSGNQSAGGSLGAAPRHGPLRLVGIAPAEHAIRAVAWLQAAAAAGADVSLVTDAKGSGSVRTRSLARFGPLNVLRAIDAEDQIRTPDAIVAFGQRSQRYARLVPIRSRGLLSPIDGDVRPEDALEVVSAAADARGGGRCRTGNTDPVTPVAEPPDPSL